MLLEEQKEFSRSIHCTMEHLGKIAILLFKIYIYVYINIYGVQYSLVLLAHVAPVQTLVTPGARPPGVIPQFRIISGRCDV